PKHKYETTIPDDPSLARSKPHTELEDDPVVGGAYTLVKRVRGQEFVLERRESYYVHEGRQVRDRPYFKTVRFKVIEDLNTALLALKSAKFDVMLLNAEQWNGQTGDDDFYRHNTKASGLEWTSFHFCWNTKTPYFEDKRVRKAMSHAMDYRELLETILYGIYTPCRGTFHETSRMFPKNGPQPYQQDLDMAEQLLDEAGWDDSDGDGIRDKEIDGRIVPFEFTLLVVNYEDRIKIVTLMKECLESIGIVCHVKPTEFTVLMQMVRDHKFQAAFAGWGTGADPDTAANIWVTNAGRNYGGYSNLRVDALFVQARHEFDEEKRMVLYGEIHNLLWEDQPYTWLFTRNSFYGFNKRLRGYNFSPRGPFHYDPGIDSLYMPALTP
ncbi:MAG: peptide ABC transporter substrate-binding protein, partial [Planctomycetes bacterium]|nr:peptide ABC transporter substrate-binding protein [Planctomycetota bacterium]